MNNIQKIFLIVCSMSIVIFVVTAYYFSQAPAQGSVFGGSFGATLETLGHRTNWLGIIALANAFGSLVGFFLFKNDK